MNSRANRDDTGGLAGCVFFRTPEKGMWLIKKRDNFTPRLLCALGVRCGNVMSVKVIASLFV